MMTLKKLVPIRREEEYPLQTLQHEMNRLFDHVFRGFDLTPFGMFGRNGWSFTPNIDVSESDKSIRISAELPGMDENDIDVSLSRDAVTLKGEKKTETEDKGKDYYRMERSYGAFHRTVPLPYEIEADKAEASFKNGVLTVTLPKSSAAQRQTRKIEIKKT